MKLKRKYLNLAIFIFVLAVIGIGGNIAIRKLNISADTASYVSSCQGGRPNGVCSPGENLTGCLDDCAGTNESIKTALFFSRAAPDGIPGSTGYVSLPYLDFFKSHLNAIAKQYKLNTPNMVIGGQKDGTYKNVYLDALGDSRAIKEANPASTVLLYRYLGKLKTDELEVSSGIIGPDKPETRDCFLRYQQGSRQGEPITGPNGYVMDITSSCWQNYLVELTNRYASQYGLDGIYLDIVTDNLENQNINYPKVISDQDLPPGYAANWKENMRTLLASLTNRIEGKVIWNGVVCKEGVGECNNQTYTNVGDGFMFERFAFFTPGRQKAFKGDFNGDGFLTKEIFQKNIDIALNAASSGKVIQISSRVLSALPSSSQEVKTLQRFFLSSYLLVSGPNTRYGVVIEDRNPIPDDNLHMPGGVVQLFDDWLTDVGSPLGAYRKNSNDVYTRDFSKAYIVVNPTEEIKDVTLPAGTYKTPEGVIVAGTYRLDPHHGQILLKNITKAFCRKGSCELRAGYNTVTTDMIINTVGFKDVGATLFDYNITGEKLWRRSNATDRLIGSMYPGQGYYVYSPKSQTAVNFVLIFTPLENGVKSLPDVKLRRGWNLISNSSDQSEKLSYFHFSVLNPASATDCTESICFEDKDLDSILDRLYHKIVLIKNGNTTYADKAFEYIELNGADLTKLTIPAHTAFWVYLKQ